MNTFRIQFIQGKTDADDYAQVKHVIEDVGGRRKIISLSISAEKLQGVSNYSREPRRLVFECMMNDWIRFNIMSGDNEHERYISHYEVRCYRDGIQVFSGIIDTSQLVYDVSTQVVRFTCFDKLKLFSLYSDVTHNYNVLSGYYPHHIISYMITDIQRRIPVNIPFSPILGNPIQNIESGDYLRLCRVQYDDIQALPVGTGGWIFSYHGSSWPSPSSGYLYRNTSETLMFIFAHKVVVEASDSYGGHAWKAYYRGRIYTFYNNMCPVVIEYEDSSGWIYNEDDLDGKHRDFMDWWKKHGIYDDTLAGLTPTYSDDGRYYGRSVMIGQYVDATFYGNIYPRKLHIGKGYEIHEDYQTDSLKAIQAILMLYNATLMCTTYGVMMLVRKPDVGNTVVIDNDSVISMNVKRGDPEIPDTSVLDIFSGDTKRMQELLNTLLVDFYAGKWSIDLKLHGIEEHANVGLQSVIVMDGKEYVVNERGIDFINNNVEVRAWQR